MRKHFPPYLYIKDMGDFFVNYFFYLRGAYDEERRYKMITGLADLQTVRFSE